MLCWRWELRNYDLLVISSGLKRFLGKPLCFRGGSPNNWISANSCIYKYNYTMG